MCARVSDKGRLELVKTDVANCRYKDERGGYDREQLRQWGGQHDRREDRPTLYFPIPTPFGIDVFQGGQMDQMAVGVLVVSRWQKC